MLRLFVAGALVVAARAAPDAPLAHGGATRAWAAAAVDDAARLPADAAAFARKPVGVVVYAARVAQLQRAFKLAASARRAAPSLEGAPRHANTFAHQRLGFVEAL